MAIPHICIWLSHLDVLYDFRNPQIHFGLELYSFIKIKLSIVLINLDKKKLDDNPHTTPATKIVFYLVKSKF